MSALRFGGEVFAHEGGPADGEEFREPVGDAAQFRAGKGGVSLRKAEFGEVPEHLAGKHPDVLPERLDLGSLNGDLQAFPAEFGHATARYLLQHDRGVGGDEGDRVAVDQGTRT
ncbi:hypothetical protein OG948_34205 (plasmid) [Embleya sp. NBC_00888]|uniref:hypothetical protein n=1 Tax=Embleya sp. NBC_00888 TaxID=2975960 RepID=UPI00386FFF09|nr:hypothetical protein OG948_34205 [Embleya sp. NBC_00888]